MVTMCLDLISISESYIHIIQQYRILFLLTWKYFLPLSLLDKSMSVIQNILQVSKSLAAAGEAQHELLYLSFFPPFTLKLGRNTILCRNKTNCFLMSAFIGSYWADLDTKGYLFKTNTLPTFQYFKTSKLQYEYVCCLSVVESLEMRYHNRIKCEESINSTDNKRLKLKKNPWLSSFLFLLILDLHIFSNSSTLIEICSYPFKEWSHLLWRLILLNISPL